MPFSFTQIEQEKSGTIKFALAFLLFFYFFSALVLVYATKVFFYLSSLDTTIGPLMWPSLDGATVGWTLLGAVLGGLVHWGFSQHALIDRSLGMMSARAADPENDDERVFRNVVEEAAVATGGKHKVEPYIIPTAAMNAFALQDSGGRCVIGITEGLLKRLNREQLEAVIAHEAGHIATGDCRETTTTMALFKTFDNICDMTGRLVFSSARVGAVGGYAYGRSRRGSDGRLMLFFLMLFVLASILRLIGFLGSMFISRQREYRADAVSARLTRNPMALAEALHIISGRWKGGGMPGENMEAIFISSPRKNALEQSSNFIADLFTTHPPIEKRIAILLDMAHARPDDLEAAARRAQARFEALNPVEPKPQAQKDPLAPLRGPLGPVMIPIPGMGAATMATAVKDQCPRCRVALHEETYEGFSILKCVQCHGVLAKEPDVLGIVHSYEKSFDDRIVERGQLLRRQAGMLKQHPFDAIYDEESIVCPSCLDSNNKMHRRFVSPRFPIEVDKCKTCARVWFDKDELEVLQYLYELDHPGGA
jgi:heat shock protein HtpX